MKQIIRAELERLKDANDVKRREREDTLLSKLVPIMLVFLIVLTLGVDQKTWHNRVAEAAS